MAFYNINNTLSDVRTMAANLEAVLEGTGTWTEMTTGTWKTNTSDWTAPVSINTVMSPVSGYAYRIFKMNDTLAGTTSPWYIKVTWRNGRGNSTSSGVGISFESGTGYDALTHDITGSEQRCEVQQGSDLAVTYDITNTYFLAYDSGFAIINLSVEGPYACSFIAGVERTKNIQGTLTDQLAFYCLGGNTGDTIMDTVNGVNYWKETGSTNGSVCKSIYGVSCIRDYATGVVYEARTLLILSSVINAATAVYNIGANVSMNRPGGLSSLTCGPYLECSNGIYGPPRLILFASSADITPGATQEIMQDGVSRSFYAPVGQRITDTTYLFYGTNYTLLIPQE
jgi:hypothetical protein